MKSLPCSAGLLLLLSLANGCGAKKSNPDSTGDTTGSAITGSTASGGSSVGGNSGSSDIGGTSASSASGGEAGGDSGAGGTAGCVDACEIYGPPCCIGSEACIEPGGSCVLEILSATVDVIYEYASLEQKVAELPEEVLVSITDADIAFAAADPIPAARFEFELTPEASALHTTMLEDGAIHPFRLSCNGQHLFVGVTYLSYGAAAIKTPVLHIGRNDEDHWVLALGAFQGAWGGLTSSDAAGTERIDRPELRGAFCQRGALRELEVGAVPPDT